MFTKTVANAVKALEGVVKDLESVASNAYAEKNLLGLKVSRLHEQTTTVIEELDRAVRIKKKLEELLS